MHKPYDKKKPQKKSYARPDAEKDLGDNIIFKARFWLEKDGETFLASGRIELLKTLAETGSISLAAEKMNISYHHAWSMIDKINSMSKKPLILASQGGKGGGGTVLTADGQALLEKFGNIKDQFQALISEMPELFTESEDKE